MRLILIEFEQCVALQQHFLNMLGEKSWEFVRRNGLELSGKRADCKKATPVAVLQQISIILIV